MSAAGQKEQSHTPITARDCLERDGKLIGSLHPQAPFSAGIESVVEALLPYHALAKDVILDSDYSFSTRLTGEKHHRESDNLQESEKGHTCVRRVLGSRHEVWDAGVVKRISRLRRRLGKMASRVRDLEKRQVEEKMCEMILHVNDASVACYSLLAKEKEVAARAKAAIVAEEQARRQALMVEMEKRKQPSVKAEEASKVSSPKPTGSIKLKLASTKPAATEGQAVKKSPQDDVAKEAPTASSVPKNDGNQGEAQQSGKFKLYAMLNKNK